MPYMIATSFNPTSGYLGGVCCVMPIQIRKDVVEELSNGEGTLGRSLLQRHDGKCRILNRHGCRYLRDGSVVESH